MNISVRNYSRYIRTTMFVNILLFSGLAFSQTIEFIGIKPTPRIMTKVAANGYQPKYTAGDVGSYIVLGRSVPIDLFKEVFDSVKNARNEWNIVIATDTQDFYSRSNDIVFGVTFNKEKIPITKPINRDDYDIFANENELIEEFIRSRYTRDIYIDANGEIIGTKNEISIASIQGVIGNDTEKSSAEWMDDIASSTFEILEILLKNNEAISNYLNVENEKTNSDIEKIALRSRYINRIVSSLY